MMKHCHECGDEIGPDGTCPGCRIELLSSQVDNLAKKLKTTEEILTQIADGLGNSLHLAIAERQVEKLSGNIVKEEFWKGQISAFTIVAEIGASET